MSASGNFSTSCALAMRSSIERMKKLARTLRDKRKWIHNWSQAEGQLSVGYCRGFQPSTRTDHHDNRIAAELPNNPINPNRSLTRTLITPGTRTGSPQQDYLNWTDVTVHPHIEGIAMPTKFYQ